MSKEEFAAIESVYNYLEHLSTEACLSLGHENAVTMEEFNFLHNSERRYYDIYIKAEKEYYGELLKGYGME